MRKKVVGGRKNRQKEIEERKRCEGRKGDVCLQVEERRKKNGAIEKRKEKKVKKRRKICQYVERGRKEKKERKK